MKNQEARARLNWPFQVEKTLSSQKMKKAQDIDRREFEAN